MSRSPGTRRTVSTRRCRTALPAGQGPDVFYVEPDQTEYITNGYIIPLDGLVNWNNIYDWARQVWTHDGKTYALPQEAYTNELYYNKDIAEEARRHAADECAAHAGRSSSIS